MSESDLFVLLDTVPFTKSGLQNRVKVKTNNGAQRLMTPVQTKGKMWQDTHDVYINDLSPWKNDHLRTLVDHWAICGPKPWKKLVHRSQTQGDAQKPGQSGDQAKKLGNFS